MGAVDFESLIRQIDKLSVPPKSRIQIMRMLEDPTVDISLLTDKIMRDPSLTANILKLSNSVFYGQSQKISTVKEAVILIGTNVIKCSLFSSLVQMFGKVDNALFLKLWKSSLYNAFIAKEAGILLNCTSTDQCFTLGLLSDIGQMVFYQLIQQTYTMILKEVQLRKLYIIDAERKTLSVTHEQIGYRVATKWNFPDLTVHVIRHHHSPSAVFEQVKLEDYKMIIAAHIATHISPIINEHPVPLDMEAIKLAGLSMTEPAIIKKLKSKFATYQQEADAITEAVFSEA